MRHPAPVMALLNRSRRTNRALRQTTRDQQVEIDGLRRLLEVQDRRARQWQRTAMELAAKVGPKAMDGCLLQVQWDEIQDLPEVAG